MSKYNALGFYRDKRYYIALFACQRYFLAAVRGIILIPIALAFRVPAFKYARLDLYFYELIITMGNDVYRVQVNQLTRYTHLH